jgi:hypothetical protein
MVRDIPYYIAINEDEQDYCCATKPLILDKLLTTLGLKCRHILCTFKWEDLNLPTHVLQMPHEDVDSHLYLEVWIPETRRWTKVDPNWDNWIKNPNIRAANWDGLHDTALAVKPLETYSAREGAKIIAELEQGGTKVRRPYLDKNRQFFESLNKWLESQRVKSL